MYEDTHYTFNRNEHHSTTVLNFRVISRVVYSELFLFCKRSVFQLNIHVPRLFVKL